MVLATTWVTAVGVPLLLALGGFVAWAVRSTIEENRASERALAEERRALYERVLEPYLLTLSSGDSAESDAEQTRMFGSPEWKRAVFELTLVASDEVVRAFGDIVNSGNKLKEDPLIAMVLWSRLLLAVRKSVGNKNTQLRLVEVLRTTINDVDENPDLLKRLAEEK